LARGSKRRWSGQIVGHEWDGARLDQKPIEFSMGLFSKLFSRKGPDVERAAALLRKALETPTKRGGAYRAAVDGADLRCRIFALAKEFEAKLGGPAAVGQDASYLVDKIIKEQPDLDIALTHCINTTDAARQLIDEWPALVAGYQGKSNSEAVLHEKSILLARCVTSNLSAAELAEELAEKKASHEQVYVMQVRVPAMGASFAGIHSRYLAYSSDLVIIVSSIRFGGLPNRARLNAKSSTKEADEYVSLLFRFKISKCEFVQHPAPDSRLFASGCPTTSPAECGLSLTARWPRKSRP
jgi:hypothetical protein